MNTLHILFTCISIIIGIYYTKFITFTTIDHLYKVKINKYIIAHWILYILYIGLLITAIVMQLNKEYYE